MRNLAKVITLIAVAMTLSASTLTDAEQKLLDRALSPHATPADKAQARKLCSKCKPCFNGNECDLQCVKKWCGK